VEAFRSGPYLTFRVGRQELAVWAAAVKAILPEHELHAAELAEPRWLAGTARAYGEVFPVIDLRRKLGLRPGPYGRNPSIIAVDTGEGLAGLLADRVSGIIHARARDFRHGKIRRGRPRQVLDPRSLWAVATL
jgi:chemotaxis signal transduction protein